MEASGRFLQSLMVHGGCCGHSLVDRPATGLCVARVSCTGEGDRVRVKCEAPLPSPGSCMASLDLPGVFPDCHLFTAASSVSPSPGSPSCSFSLTAPPCASSPLFLGDPRVTSFPQVPLCLWPHGSASSGPRASFPCSRSMKSVQGALLSPFTCLVFLYQCLQNSSFPTAFSSLLEVCLTGIHFCSFEGHMRSWHKPSTFVEPTAVLLVSRVRH